MEVEDMEEVEEVGEEEVGEEEVGEEEVGEEEVGAIMEEGREQVIFLFIIAIISITAITTII